MFKRLLCLICLLVVISMLVSLIGCSQSAEKEPVASDTTTTKAQTTTSKPATTTTAAQTTTTTAAPEPNPLETFYEITWLTQLNADWREGRWDELELEELFNVDLQVWAEDGRNTERMAQLVAAGDIPDYFYMPQAPIENNQILFKNRISDDPTVSRYISEMIWEAETNEEGYEIAVKAYVYLLLVCLLRSHKKAVLSKKESRIRSNNLDCLNKVIVYIEEHYNERLTVNQLARYAGMSTSNLHLLFKKASGKTITDYINQVRIQNADRLLRNSDMNISEIATAVGVDDSNYFTKLFKKYKKIAPSQIRKAEGTGA
jgi:AraC-like DNA-binding protein